MGEHLSTLHSKEGSEQRRRIKVEEKAKVVASEKGGGGEFIQFLAALAVLPRAILNNRTNCTRMI